MIDSVLFSKLVAKLAFTARQYGCQKRLLWASACVENGRHSTKQKYGCSTLRFRVDKSSFQSVAAMVEKIDISLASREICGGI